MARASMTAVGISKATQNASPSSSPLEAVSVLPFKRSVASTGNESIHAPVLALKMEANEMMDESMSGIPRRAMVDRAFARIDRITRRIDVTNRNSPASSSDSTIPGGNARSFRFAADEKFPVGKQEAPS